jgi:hypothetical protein
LRGSGDQEATFGGDGMGNKDDNGQSFAYLTNSRPAKHEDDGNMPKTMTVIASVREREV